MRFVERLKHLKKQVEREITMYRGILQDARTPWLAKGLLGMALVYVMMPFDLIPDWIPILGFLDDVLIVPGLVLLACKLVPPNVLTEYRQKSTHETIVSKDFEE